MSIQWNHGRFLCTINGYHTKYGEWPSEIRVISLIYHHLKAAYDPADWPQIEARLRFVVDNEELSRRRLTASNGQDKSVDYFSDGLNRVERTVDPDAWLGVLPVFKKPPPPKYCSECGQLIAQQRAVLVPGATLCYQCKMKQEQRLPEDRR